MQDPIIIVGGGIGGLSAGIRLAAAGQHVIVLEKNAAVGGKMTQIEADGFRWDTGPSVITIRRVFEELFALGGKTLDDYLTLLPVDPLTRYHYQDGLVMDITRDLSTTLGQIERLDPRDVEGYLAFLAYAARIHRITGPAFIYDEPPTWKSLLRVNPLDALKVDGLRTMQQSIQGFVRSPHLRQLLGRFATYVGGSPYQAPATLNVISHVELAEGVWYPQGGIYRIAEAMRQLAEELGVDIRTETPVQHIRIKEGRANGVQLASGEQLAAQAIICNLDVGTAYDTLLPPTAVDSQRVARLTNLAPSCSGFILLLGVDRSHSDLAHHNIFFSADYEYEFDQIFRQGHPPDDPTIYAAITAKSDPDHAPPQQENWFVLINAPALDGRYDWATQATAYRDRVIENLANKFGVDLRGHIVHERILTPLDLEHLTGARRGALYGPSPNNRWAAFLRPHNRAPDVKGLYFAGGTTHPGGGVPMVTLSGKVAAQLCLEDMA